ncbi:MAG: ATP-dependent Clp protease adaptor ClpS [Fimbriimonas sp.]
MASNPGTLERPDLGEVTANDGDWIVTVYDNDNNTFEEVIAILLLATGCTMEEAQIETWEVHHLGASVVHHGSEDECRRVGRIISRIGIKVVVSQEKVAS